VRKRLAIVGHSEEGLGLIPLLEANPDIEICAVVSLDPSAVSANLARIDPALAQRFEDRVTMDLERVLATPSLAALIDADAPAELREALAGAAEAGVQVTSPLLAKLLFAFGPVDASRKPDLLQALSEILESYNLTVDRRGLLNRILQIAVGATGADRGSLMLWDSADGRLRVEVAIGIEVELIPKIRLASGEGIAGRAFAEGRALLLTGKADRSAYRISRERDDVESAISAPLLHDGRVLGVLNLSHARRRDAFSRDDLEFVEQLASLDAKIISRAEEYHALRRESATLRSQAEVRRLLSGIDPLPRRLAAVCTMVAAELKSCICQIWIHEAERDVLVLQASSSSRDPFSAPSRLRPDEGIHGWVARSRQEVVLCDRVGDVRVCFAVLPLVVGGGLLGLLSFEGAHEGHVPELLRDKLSAVADTLSSELADALRSRRMEREATKTAAITELASRMSTCEDSTELYKTITSSGAMVLEAEHALLRLQDEGSGRYQIRSYFGSAETDQQSALFALEKDLAIEAMTARTTLRVSDLRARDRTAAEAAGVFSALVQPLRREGRMLGTLSVLGKVSTEPLSGEAFTRDDERILGRLAEHSQGALETVHERERARRLQRFDDLTGLPNAVHLRERLEQEIARSSGRGRALALVRLRLDGLQDLLRTQQQAEGDRLALSIAQELRAGLRDFDILARTGPDTFEILLPEPDTDVSALLGPLARRTRDAISREPGEDLGERLALEFGYAVFPTDAQTVSGLQDKAREPRIRSI
jgi:diguanylate cyclase (GGDEF)-like protein